MGQIGKHLLIAIMHEYAYESPEEKRDGKIDSMQRLPRSIDALDSRHANSPLPFRPPISS